MYAFPNVLRSWSVFMYGLCLAIPPSSSSSSHGCRAGATSITKNFSYVLSIIFISCIIILAASYQFVLLSCYRSISATPAPPGRLSTPLQTACLPISEWSVVGNWSCAERLLVQSPMHIAFALSHLSCVHVTLTTAKGPIHHALQSHQPDEFPTSRGDGRVPTASHYKQALSNAATASIL